MPSVASSNPTRTAGCVCMLVAPLWCGLGCWEQSWFREPPRNKLLGRPGLLTILSRCLTANRVIRPVSKCAYPTDHSYRHSLPSKICMSTETAVSFRSELGKPQTGRCCSGNVDVICSSSKRGGVGLNLKRLSTGEFAVNALAPNSPASLNGLMKVCLRS